MAPRSTRPLEARRFLVALLLLMVESLLAAATEGGKGVRIWPQTEETQIGKMAQFPLPSFTEDVANSTVVVGRSATLKCSVQNLNKYKIAWVKSDTQTLLSIENTMITRNYRLRVSHSDDTTWFLHIDEASMSDRGYYMCQINTVPPLVKQGYLEVVVPPNIVDDNLSADTEVNEDSPAQLKCMATGFPAPDIRFRRQEGRMLQRGTSKGKDSTRILTKPEEIQKLLKNGFDDNKRLSKGLDHYRGVALSVGYLTFDKVSRNDMGHYLCIANNSVPPSVSKRIILNVRYRDPEVEVGQQMLGVYQGDDVAINCTVTAYPRPVVFWQDGTGRMIISGGRYQVYERTLKESPPILMTTLVINNIHPEDITSYTCNASIDNDEERSKSLVVQLNEMQRLATDASNLDILHQVPPRGTPRKKYPTADINPVNNDIIKRFEKPASYIPEVFLNPSVGSGGLDSSDEDISSSLVNRLSKANFQVTAVATVSHIILFYANRPT